MKIKSYMGIHFPTKCAKDFFLKNALVRYLFEMMHKIKIWKGGTGFALFVVENEKGARGRSTRFKMGESKFAGKIKLNDTIKYGAILYVSLVMLAMPAALCGSQHMALQMVSPAAEVEGSDMDHRYIDLMRYFLPLQGIVLKDAPARAEKALPGSPPFHRSILRAAQTYKVDAALIRAIIFAESNYNPQAVSRAGARGLMQLMPTTARWLGVEDPFDPELNIDGGVRYFKRLLDRFDGDVELALAAYNAGSRHVKNYGGVPPFKATRLYIKKVLKYHQKYRQEMGGRFDYS